MKLKFAVKLPRVYITLGFLLFFSIAVATAYINIMSSMVIANMASYPFKSSISTSELFYLIFGIMACLNQSILLYGILSVNKTATNIGLTFALGLYPAFLVSGLGVLDAIQDRADEISERRLNSDIQKYGYDDTISATTDVLQRKYKCCGVKGIDDWINSTFHSCTPSEEGSMICSVPVSCCDETEIKSAKPFCLYEKINSTSEISMKQIHPYGSVYTQGCKEALLNHLDTARSVMTGFTAMLYVWQFLSIWITCEFTDIIKKEMEFGLIQKVYYQ